MRNRLIALAGEGFHMPWGGRESKIDWELEQCIEGANLKSRPVRNQKSWAEE